VKRIYSVAFLLILLVNSAGFYIYYVIQLQQIKEEMREALKLKPDYELNILVLSRQAYAEAKVEDHEIRVNGKMYDVARTKISGDQVTVYCLHDKAEDDLMGFLAEIIRTPLKENSHVPDEILEFIGMDFIAPDNLITCCYTNKDQNQTRYFFPLKMSTLRVSTPPPWCLS
jgi:hypothetical protein